jgi:hypothetical protein
MSIGKMADTKGYLDLSDVRSLLAPFLVTPYVSAVIAKAYAWIDGLKFKSNNTLISKKEYLFYFIFMTICWVIVLLGVYPGFFVYDAADELLEVITRNFNTHHPLLHVLYLGGTVQAGYKLFGSYNVGIFVFSLIQMFIFEVGILYVIRKMARFGFDKMICRIMVVFMGLFPIIPMMVLCSSKDSIFALVLFVWIAETYDLVFMDSNKRGILWIALSALLCLLRYNAVYALIVSGLFALIVSKGKRIRYALLLTGSIVVYFAISSLLTGVLDASSTEYQEMLTVPIQQIARTYNLSPDVYSDEEIELLYEYIPKEYLEKYSPKLSDGVKVSFVNDKYKEDKIDFWKIWVSGMVKAPMSYLNAWIMTSYGYLYPDTVVDVYKGNQVYTFTYGESSYFGYETEEPGTRNSLIPIIDKFYKDLSLEIFKEKLPVISILFSMGSAVWFYVFVVGYIVRVGGFRKCLPYIMPFMIIATLLLGPTYLPRYIFFIWLSLPFVIGDAIKNKFVVY